MKPTLIKKRTGWRLTILGRLLAIMLVAALFLGFMANLYPFLAPEAPPHKGLLVVEGWIHDFALDEAVTLYRTGDYSKIICTGGPIETGSYIQSFKSFPEMTAARLRKMGIPEGEIIMAIGEETKKDRTYAAAIALREAFMAYNIKETNLHLVTVGPHGRRSRLLFQKALGKDYHVGITCLEDSGYDPERWYTYSRGVRSVISEFVGYIYAKCSPHP